MGRFRHPLGILGTLIALMVATASVIAASVVLLWFDIIWLFCLVIVGVIS